MKMKFKIIYSILFVFSGVVMPACSDSDDEISGNDTPPAGALPSAEFEPNSLPDEPYAEDAIRIVAEEEYAPFYALELMPDGNYLLTTARIMFMLLLCMLPRMLTGIFLFTKVVKRRLCVPEV